MLYRNPVGNEWKETEAAHPVLSNYKVWFSAFLPALWFAFNLRERLFIFMHSCILLCVLIRACRYNSIRHSVLVCLFFCILANVYHQKKRGSTKIQKPQWLVEWGWTPPPPPPQQPGRTHQLPPPSSPSIFPSVPLHLLQSQRQMFLWGEAAGRQIDTPPLPPPIWLPLYLSACNNTPPPLPAAALCMSFIDPHLYTIRTDNKRLGPTACS